MGTLEIMVQVVEIGAFSAIARERIRLGLQSHDRLRSFPLYRAILA